MRDAIFGILWANPHLFYLLPLVVFASVVGAWYLYRVRLLLGAWQGDQTRRSLLQNATFGGVGLRIIFLLVALVSVFVALLRPQWGMEESVESGSGRAVLVALDVSRSMCAQDVKPSRIGFAKQRIKELITMLKAERVGLLIFSGEALLLCPLTTDYDAFAMFLDNIAVEAVSSGTTSLGAALEKILSTFSGQEREGTRLVVLFTDGEDFSGRVNDGLEKVRASGVRLCLVGVGSAEGGPIPTYDEHGRQNGFLKDSDGHVVVSRSQGGVMKELADKTGGLFLQGRDVDMSRVKRWIERFERSKFGDRRAMREREQFFWYTGAAFLLLLMGLLV